MTKGDVCGQNLQDLAANPYCSEFVHQLKKNPFPYVIEVGKSTQKTKWTVQKFSHLKHQT